MNKRKYSLNEYLMKLLKTYIPLIKEGHRMSMKKSNRSDDFQKIDKRFCTPISHKFIKSGF